MLVRSKILTRCLQACTLLVAMLIPSQGYALVGEIWDYVSQYQVGVDYTSSVDGVTANYETDKTPNMPTSCVDEPNKPSKARCSVPVRNYSGGWGIFLQQAFKRQGDFYFKPDLGFGVRYLSGRYDQKNDVKDAGLPLQTMQYSLAAFILKPYIQFGITPASKWPDILISMGPTAQVAVGRVQVNKTAQAAAVATTSDSYISGFFEPEIVFWRFGKGALSLFSESDFSSSNQGTKFYPKTIDGMDDIRANFTHSTGGGFWGFGAKLVLNWP